MFKTIWFWLKNSRLFSLPMSFLSWLVAFVYAQQLGGNVLNGIVAAIGIMSAHLATNLFDDYLDYKDLPENSQKCKCAYIKEGKATLEDVLKVVCVYCSISTLTGLYLFIKCGFPVIYLAVIGGLFTLLYTKLSKRGLSEVAVGVAFGPLLFEGVYYVMLGKFSFEAFVLSLAVVLFTIGLMYTHTVLDYEGDLCASKMTLACRTGSKNKAINGVFVVYGLGYLFTIILSLMIKNYYILLTFLLLPLVFNLRNSLKSYVCGSDINDFYFRLLKARNLMIYYSLLITLFLLF